MIPENIKNIISDIERAGHKAYAVGGCVRDSILGRMPYDWDVCTSAKPKEIMAIFGERAIPTGLKHGTVTVKSGSSKAEVTTFRIDGAYSDHRRPDSVSFSSSLLDDLSRRDFTMNAMAMDLGGEIIDPFGGRKDIENRLIRCVGDPAERFEEDALRMFRCLRFAAVLGFNVQRETFSALYEKAVLARNLAPERILTELDKLLTAEHLSPLASLFDSGLMDAYCTAADGIDFTALKLLPRDRLLRRAGLCALLGSTDILSALHCDSAGMKLCSAGIAAAKEAMPLDRAGWKALLSREGSAGAHCAAAAWQVLYGINALDALGEVLSSGEPWSLKHLALDGRDIAALGLEGTEIGRVLHLLLTHVIFNPGDNQREKLIEIAKGAV